MKNFIEAARRMAAPPRWSAPFTPMLAGYTCAFTLGGARLDYEAVLWMLAAFFAIALIETGKNALNDILDHTTGNDALVDAAHTTPFSGGMKVLLEGLVSVKQLWILAGITIIPACIIGVIIAYCLSAKILVIGVIGMAMALLYNLPQARFIYKGWGEACIFTAYGPVCAMGAYHMFVDAFSWIPFLISISHGLLIVNVLLINELPDYEADRQAGKRNWTVRLGKAGSFRLYRLFYWAHLIPFIILMHITGSPLWLLVFLTIPMFRGIVKNVKANLNDIPALMPSNADTFTVHSRCGMFANTVVVMLYLIGA